jgi:hypothetical protein
MLQPETQAVIAAGPDSELSRRVHREKNMSATKHPFAGHAVRELWWPRALEGHLLVFAIC